MCAFVCVRVGMYESVCIEKKYRKSVEKIYTCKKILVLPVVSTSTRGRLTIFQLCNFSFLFLAYVT